MVFIEHLIVNVPDSVSRLRRAQEIMPLGGCLQSYRYR